MNEKAGLYVHIPFCEMRCHYCDFLTFAHVEEGIPAYLDALHREIASAKASPEMQALTFDSIFLGGGTPSLLSCDQLTALMRVIRDSLHISADAEISIECNPNTVTEEKARCMYALGINRISLAVQSFDDALLQRCGRNHSAEIAKRDFSLLREVGFDDISLDMILAIPTQTEDQLRNDVETALALKPDHISYYSLILEERTRFWLWYERGELELIPDDVERRYFHIAKDMMEEAGFRRYEISNFAKSGKESRHNLKYWNVEPYWGVGLGAASELHGERYANVRSVLAYREEVFVSPLSKEKREDRTDEDRVFEFIMLQTRKVEGFSLAEFQERFGFSFLERYDEVLRPYFQMEEAIMEDGRFLLTERGMDLQNQILTDLLIEIEG